MQSRNKILDDVFARARHIHPGQTITAEVFIPADAPPTIQASLYVYDAYGQTHHQAVGTPLTPGEWHTLTYSIPALAGACLSQVGIVVRNLGANWTVGALHVRSLDWDGAPDYAVDFSREQPAGGAITQWTRWRGYWRVEADGHYHGSGPGLCETYTGDIQWADYRVEARIVPEIGDHHHVNVRVQGALRSYAAGLAPDGRFVLYRKDGLAYSEVAAADFAWQHGAAYTLTVDVQGDTLHAAISSETASASCAWTDPAPYRSGQVGLSTWHNSHTRCEAFRVSPLVEG